MSDIRMKVAYERAALLVDAEADKHSPDENFNCVHCGQHWNWEKQGCRGLVAMRDLAAEIRAYKADAH